MGSLDSPWTSFAESMERLLGLVRSKEGIETVIKTLEVKLSEAIMYAMQNGPELEKKVSQLFLHISTMASILKSR